MESIDKIAFSKKNFELLVPDWTHKEPDVLGNVPDEDSAIPGQRHGSPDVTVSSGTTAQRKLKDRDSSSSPWGLSPSFLSTDPTLQIAALCEHV